MARSATNLQAIVEQVLSPRAFSTSGFKGLQKLLRMSPQALTDASRLLTGLPALADELTHQRAPVLTGFGLEISETLLGLSIEPDGEGHSASETKPQTT